MSYPPALQYRYRYRYGPRTGKLRPRERDTATYVLYVLWVGENGIGSFDQVFCSRLHAAHHQPGGCEASPEFTSESYKAAV